MMKYAQIKNDKIQNVIVLEDPSLKLLFGIEMGFQALVKIDSLDVCPGIGWDYNSDSASFSVTKDQEA